MKNTKKGFTLVELLVVIAIIAILATVAIIGYTSFLDKADESNDRTLVAQLNTAVTKVDGEYVTMHEVIEALDAQGFVASRIPATSEKHDILWDMKKQEFFYSADHTDRKGAHIWIVSDRVSTDYSTYYIGANDVVLNDVTLGFDAGNATGLTVKYAGSNDVILRMNGGALEVADTSGAQQYFYGDADTAKIATGTSCFHVNGNIGFVELTEGKFVQVSGKTNAVVYDEAKATVEEKENADIVIQKKSSEVSADDIETIKTGATKFAGGTGTEEDPYVIANREHMDNLLANADNYAYYKVVDANVNIDFSMWVPGALHGSFDGNGATFNINTNLFSRVDIDEEGYVKNLTVNANINSSSAVAVFGSLKGTDDNLGSLTFENVDINGSIIGAGAATYGSYVYVENLTFKDCTSSAIVTTTNNGTGSAGFVIHTYHAKNVYLINSVFTGTLYHTGNGRAGYWCDMSSTSIWYVDEASSPNNGLYTVNTDRVGNKSGQPYITSEKVTIDNVEYTAYTLTAIPGEGDTKITTWYTLVQAVKTYQGVQVQSATSQEMFTGNKLTIEKSAEANSCKVTLFVSPHDKNNEGGYLGAYYSEDAVLVGDNWSSDEIVNFIIKINGNATKETGISADGKTFNIVNDFYGHQYGTAYVQFVEYDIDGVILSITNITISNVNE